MSALHRLITGLVLCYAAPVLACMPCLSRSSLDHTIEQSDAIVLLRNDERSSSNAMDVHPETVELSVIKVYKGDIDASTLMVRSWYGECAYGIQVPYKGEALAFLQEEHDIATGFFDGNYKLVEDGCSQGQMEVKRNLILLDNKWVSLSSFTEAHIK